MQNNETVSSYFTTPPVPPPNAVVDPGAVMVQDLHASVALTTVFCSDGAHGLTRVAQIVDWVVHVIVVSPRGRIAYLGGKYHKGRRMEGRREVEKEGGRERGGRKRERREEEREKGIEGEREGGERVYQTRKLGCV